MQNAYILYIHLKHVWPQHHIIAGNDWNTWIGFFLSLFLIPHLQCIKCNTMYYLSTAVQCCQANVSQWDYHIYGCAKIFFCGFHIIQHYGNVAKVKANKKLLVSVVRNGEFFSITMCWKSPGEKKRLLLAAAPELTDLAIQVGRHVSQPSSQMPLALILIWAILTHMAASKVLRSGIWR